MQVKGNCAEDTIIKCTFLSVFYDDVRLYSGEQQDKLTSWKGSGRKQE
jgi:hypothetical protein